MWRHLAFVRSFSGVFPRKRMQLSENVWTRRTRLMSSILLVCGTPFPSPLPPAAQDSDRVFHANDNIIGNIWQSSEVHDNDTSESVNRLSNIASCNELTARLYDVSEQRRVALYVNNYTKLIAIIQFSARSPLYILFCAGNTCAARSGA